jgi:recyclin-1
VLASFTDVLILPVTIVPRAVGAVGAVLTTSGRGAAQGIAMLNPQRWGGGANGYSRNVGTEDVVIFNQEDEEEHENLCK